MSGKKKPFAIATKIHIQASAETVWAILTDFQSYPEWNSFITSMAGSPVEGTQLSALILPPGGSAMKFKPKVLVAKPGVEFRWLGNLWFPGLFDGEHYFQINDHQDGSCTLTQGENFSGILVPLFKNMLQEKTQKGFENMNSALKDRAEG